MTSPPPGYVEMAALVGKIVRDWTGPPLRFRFPHPDIEIAADLAQAGDLLALNTAARDLLGLIVIRAAERFGSMPTVVMLRSALEANHVATELATLEELGLEVVRGGNPS
jgi:hypothetical protein